MPIRDLPARPSLAQLKRQADELHRDHRAGKVAAVERVTAGLVGQTPRGRVVRPTRAGIIVRRSSLRSSGHPRPRAGALPLPRQADTGRGLV